jgi:hypothetical protein
MDSAIIPQENLQFIDLPEEDCYVLLNCSVPHPCLRNVTWPLHCANADGLVRCNIHIEYGTVQNISPITCTGQGPSVDLENACVFPTFADVHTHIGVALYTVVQAFQLLAGK